MINIQKLTIGAAVGALMASTALAQAPAPSAPAATPPAAHRACDGPAAPPRRTS